MGSSDDIFKNPWANSGGEKVTEWQDGNGINDQIENGKKPDTSLPGFGYGNVKSDF